MSRPFAQIDVFTMTPFELEVVLWVRIVSAIVPNTPR